MVSSIGFRLFIFTGLAFLVSQSHLSGAQCDSPYPPDQTWPQTAEEWVLSGELIAAGADFGTVIEPAPAPHRYILEYQRDLWEDLFSTGFSAQTSAYHLDQRPHHDALVVTGVSSHGDDFTVVVGAIWVYDGDDISPADLGESNSDYFLNGGGFSFLVGDITTEQHTRRVFGAAYSVAGPDGLVGEYFIPLYDASAAYVQELMETGVWVNFAGSTHASPGSSSNTDPVNVDCWNWAVRQLQRCYDDAHANYRTCMRLAAIQIIGGLISIPFTGPGSLILIGTGAATAAVCEAAWRTQNEVCRERFDEDYESCVNGCNPC